MTARMTSPPFTVDLLELAADVALVGAPRDDVASEILATHSLPDVFARLAAVPTGSKEESDLCVFLERMFATAPGATLLPSAMPYAEAGLAAASPRVRRLACAQLERAFAQLATEPYDTDDDSRSCVPDEIVRELIETIRDPDPGVAAAASSALAALATTVPETINPIVARLSDFVADRREPATRLRAHALAATLASASLRAAAAVAERGLRDELLHEIEDAGDPLAAMAAMELLAELVEAEAADPSAARALATPLLPKLAKAIAGDEEEDSDRNEMNEGSYTEKKSDECAKEDNKRMKSMDAIDEKVRASAVKLKRAFAGSAPGHVRARAALTGARIAAAVGSKGSIAILGSRDNDSLLSFLQALQRAAEDEDDEVCEAACVAVGTLAETLEGAAALVADPNVSSGGVLLASVVSTAFGVSGDHNSSRRGARVAALHALATLAGAGISSGRRHETTHDVRAHDPVGVPPRFIAALGGIDPLAASRIAEAAAADTEDADAADAAEAAIRDRVYEVAEARGSTPAELLWSGALQNSGDAFLELRVAAYRCIAALGRRNWFASEILMHEAALAKVTDNCAESTPPGCRWRHEAALGLLAAMKEERARVRDPSIPVMVSEEAAAALAATVARGPFSAGAGVRVGPQVALARR